MNPGRCGSTLVSDLLARHPQVLSVQEYMISLGSLGYLQDGPLSGAVFWELISGPSAIEDLVRRLGRVPREIIYTGAIRAVRGARTAMPRILGVTLAALGSDPDELFGWLAGQVPGFPDQDLGAHHRQLLGLLMARSGARTWTERSGGNCGYIDRLLPMFPGAKVIYLSRNCVDTVASMRRHAYFQLATIGEQFERLCAINPFDEDAPEYGEGIPRELRPLLPQNLTAGILDQRGQLVEPFVLRWVTQDLQARSVLSTLPCEQALEISYDELVTAPVAQLTRIGRFLELDDAAGWAGRAAGLVARQPGRASQWLRTEADLWREKITRAILTAGTYQPSTVA